MSTNVKKQWEECCGDVRDNLKRLSENGVSLCGQSETKLKELIKTAPTTEAELDEAVTESERLLESHRSQIAFEDSANHETIAIPTRSMAEQTEDAKKLP